MIVSAHLSTIYLMLKKETKRKQQNNVDYDRELIELLIVHYSKKNCCQEN